MAHGEEGVASVGGGRGMGRGAVDLDLERVFRRHRHLGVDADDARRQPGPAVEPEHRVDLREVDRPGLEDRSRSALLPERDLLCGLEQDCQRPRPIRHRGQPLGRGDDHRHVDVVPTGVHHARRRRPVLHVVRLGERKRIEIGADHHSGAVASCQSRHDPRSGHSGGDLISGVPQPGAQQLGGPMLCESKLGTPVDFSSELHRTPPPIGELLGWREFGRDRRRRCELALSHVTPSPLGCAGSDPQR